ncbi:fucose 4-O-acetylase-like acetyltransferase [Mycolicibacterium moriokaense]|uniref:Fucose 4-O-acetylase-like acetyltransferase n=1 Tax=Mycolicibacterium moriokaense TaxID=39691 RepID=A0A318HF97_9MYCO|nr:fucose 4-O-acetylase-like acetyltransferase [Mycolicibacterium moriokaense]
MPKSWEDQPAPEEVARTDGNTDGDRVARGGHSDTAVGPDSDRKGQTDVVGPQGGAEGARVTLKARVDFLDIAKGVMIIVVVFAHLVEHFGTYDPLFKAVYAAVSLTGLPVFVIASGMLAKPVLGETDYRKMFAKLLLPLICLQPFYLALYARAGGDAVRHILDPQWLLWFLLSLLLWRMMLPLFLQIPMALLVAVGITLAAGYATDIGADLSLSRTLYFFPFFLAGYLWRERLLRLVARARLFWGLAFVGLLVGMALWFLHGLDTAVVYHDRSYDQASVWSDYPALGRLVLLLISTVGCLCWMAILPRSSNWLVRMGQRSLTILALHGFVVLVCLKLFNLVGWTYSPSPILFPLLAVMAVAIAWAVSLLDGPFNRFFDWLAARLSPRSRTR